MAIGNLRAPLRALGLTAALLATSIALAQTQPQLPDVANAPVKTYGKSQPIPDRYIIKFKDSVRDPENEARGLMAGRGGEIHFVYTHAIKGFAATIPSQQALQGIRMNPWVELIERDQTVSVEGLVEQTTVPSWGLDRIDQIGSVGSGDGKYFYDSSAGSGVYAYIIDTGIRATHAEFRIGSTTTSRVQNGYNATSTSTSTDDCNGHGTHVAGTVGGKNVGVAKNVKLVPVKVLGCNGSGTISGVIKGVDYVTLEVTKTNNPRRPAVANMSVGGGYSQSLNDAVAQAVVAGVTVAVAAGNSSTDASTSSPASEPMALTVGATTKADAWASYSNYGPLLDVLAPGSSIVSSYKQSDTSYATMSGTSMATPHVTGVAALAISSRLSNSDLSPTKAGATWAVIASDAIAKAASAPVITGLPSNTTTKLLNSRIEP